ncbi:type II CAAX prenyl endopeptidase Rce1 family protein [Mucilaginibacter sp.]|jgi:membrane protease YdiL (CAAX protease family)|uniref:CPBP family glutamic-type intramembrane protease n=1 Tax=Mucilaginibacter sp. TaxID=1882438 RepID=UPI00356AC170
MKNLFRTYPDWTRLVVGAVLLAAALIGSGFIHLPYIPAGLLLVILVTWLLYRSENKNLTALGFDLKRGHLLLIPAGLLLGMGSFLLSFYVGTLVRGDHIVVSHTTDWNGLLKAFWWVFPTAAVQDFIVVGYCYNKLIRLTNKWVATVAFGLFFISLHDVWGGNFVNVLFYAVGLFVGYLMFSTALLRSGSIWLVIGIHWGNNFTNSFLFTFSHTPTSWLYLSGQQQQNLNVWQAIGLFIALNIGAAAVIALVLLLWKTKDSLQLSDQKVVS